MPGDTDIKQCLKITKLNIDKISSKNLNLDIEKYIASLNTKGFERSTVLRKISALGHFFNFLVEEEILESNPIKKIQKFYKDVSFNKDKLSNLYGTFNNFQISSTAKNRIDYIFYKNFILIDSNHGNVKTKQGRWASDHHPVISLFNFF